MRRQDSSIEQQPQPPLHCQTYTAIVEVTKAWVSEHREQVQEWQRLLSKAPSRQMMVMQLTPLELSFFQSVAAGPVRMGSSGHCSVGAGGLAPMRTFAQVTGPPSTMSSMLKSSRRKCCQMWSRLWMWSLLLTTHCGLSSWCRNLKLSPMQGTRSFQPATHFQAYQLAWLRKLSKQSAQSQRTSCLRFILWQTPAMRLFTSASPFCFVWWSLWVVCLSWCFLVLLWLWCWTPSMCYFNLHQMLYLDQSTPLCKHWSLSICFNFDVRSPWTCHSNLQKLIASIDQFEPVCSALVSLI